MKIEKMPHISVVIPVYEAEACLHELYKRLLSTLSSITNDFEIIMIEDGGADGSWQLICELANNDRRIKGIHFSRNFGQHNAITAGLDKCQGDWVVVMDCDLQDQPEEIPRLYQKALDGYDVVLANRGKRVDPMRKRFFSRVFYWIFCYLLDMEYSSEAGNFRIISKKVVDSCREIREQLRFFSGMVAWLGYPTANIEVTHAPRHQGKSSYSFRRLCKLASELIIGYSDRPLRLSIKLGFTISLLSFLYGIYIFLRALIYHTQVPGWSSLIVSIYFIGGIIIAILGVIGIYLGKTFDETKKRPLYIVKDVTFE